MEDITGDLKMDNNRFETGPVDRTETNTNLDVVISFWLAQDYARLKQPAVVQELEDYRTECLYQSGCKSANEIVLVLHRQK